MWGEDAREEMEVFVFVFVDVNSSAVTMLVECFFRRPRALWGESVLRKLFDGTVDGLVA